MRVGVRVVHSELEPCGLPEGLVRRSAWSVFSAQGLLCAQIGMCVCVCVYIYITVCVDVGAKKKKKKRGGGGWGWGPGSFRAPSGRFKPEKLIGRQ